MGFSWIEIDERRLRHNVSVFRRLLGATGTTTKLMAVVKANAYGHGASLVAPILAESVDWFGVDSLTEAEELARGGIAKPILILGHTEPGDAERVVAGGFRQVLFRRDVAEALSRAGGKLERAARVHLKVETGLHRLGIPFPEVLQLTDGLEHLIVEGVYTHFADVENPASELLSVQLARLREAVRALQRASATPLLTHASPTAGALLYGANEHSLTRVGIGLYGIWPSSETRASVSKREPDLSLQPVLSWKSRLAQVKTVPAGATVGYDLTFRAGGPRRIGVVPVGYYDGYSRSLSNRGVALVGGRKVPVVGRIAMNMLMLDVTETEARDGDEVVLIGDQGEETVTAEDVASASDTIAYEVVARLNPRMPRRLR